MDNASHLIDELIKKRNYAPEKWEKRGLNPSPPDVIDSLETVTNAFYDDIKKLHLDKELSSDEKKRKIHTLVDDLPWPNFDTEEREFLADTIAPAITIVGFDPWSII